MEGNWRRKSLNKEFGLRSWHSGWQAERNLLNKEFESRSWLGSQGKRSLNQELPFRTWHCWKARGGPPESRIRFLDHAIVAF